MSIDSKVVGSPPLGGRVVPVPVVGLLLYLWLAFPFFVRNIDASLYRIGLTALLLVNLAWLLFSKTVHHEQQAVKGSVALFVFAYALFFLNAFGASIYAFLESMQPAALKGLLYSVFVLAVAAYLYMTLDVFQFRRIVGIYVNLMVVLCVTGSLLVLLVYLGRISPAFPVTLDNGSTREFVWLGFVWKDTWIGSRIGLVRLQSFSDEAGTFAFAILPALIFALYSGYFWRSILLTIGMLMTFSVGALGAMSALSFAFVLSRRGRVGREGKMYIGFVVSLLVLGLAGYLVWSKSLGGFLETYLSAKFGSGTRTSLGDRVQAIQTLLPMILEKPFGAGFGALNVDKLTVAVGWIVPLFEGGVVGFVFYVMAFGALLLMAVKNLRRGTAVTAYAYVILVLMIAGLQRTRIDATVWGWFWIVGFIKEMRFNASGNRLRARFVGRPSKAIVELRRQGRVHNEKRISKSAQEAAGT